MADWIKEVDPSGSLDGMVAGLEENYDCPEQIVELYVVLRAGRQTFDEQFFDDMEITGEAQRKHFRAWFARRCGKEAEHAAPSPAQESAVAAAPASTGGPEPELTFQAWLRDVDPTGSLDTWATPLEENYDDLQQIIDLYVLEREGCKTAFDERFFDDMEITGEAQRKHFRAWFARRCGKEAEHAAPSPAPARESAVAAAPASTGGPKPELTLQAWLRDVDPTGSLDTWATLLEENYDDLQQIIDLYVLEREGCKAAFDERFFDDMEITSGAEKGLFRAWFASNCDTAP